MPRYSRLFDDDDPLLNTGYIGQSNGHTWGGAGNLEPEDLSFEPTSNGGALRLTTINDDGTNETDDGARKKKCGFCFWYAKFLDRFPVLFCILLFALTAGGGAAAFVLYDIPSFDDPLEGFQARQTDINDRTSGLRHFDHVTNDDHFYTLPRQSKRSLAGVFGTSKTTSSSSTSYALPSRTSMPSSLSKPSTTSPWTSKLTSTLKSTQSSPLTMSSSSPSSSSSPKLSRRLNVDDNGIHANHSSMSTRISSTDIPLEEFTDDMFTTVMDYGQASDYEGPVIEPTACGQRADSAPWQLRLVFSRIGKVDLFSTKAMRSMCSLYNRIVANNTDVTNCQPASLGFYASLIDGRDSCDDIVDDDVMQLRQGLQKCAPFFLNGELRTDCGRLGTCPTVPLNCTLGNVVFNILKYMLPFDSAELIARGNFESINRALMVTPIYAYSNVAQDIYKDNIMGQVVSDSVTKLSAVGGGFKFDLFSDFLVSDSVYLAGGIGLILVIVWVYTGSLFVTIMTILDMIMSLVFSYFLYVVVFKMPFFPFMNVLAFVLVIGIGADDAFVYVDIWKKMRERHGGTTGKRVLVIQDTLHHAAIAMFVTSFTTSSALFSNVISSITALRCLSVYAGCAILINFVYTVTWLPAIVVIEDKYLQFRRCRDRITPSDCYLKLKEVFNTISKYIRSFWETILPLVVFKLRYLWILLFTLLGVGGACAIFVKPKLLLPTKNDFQVFISSDYMEQYDQIYKKEFLFERGEQQLMPIIFTWGVVPIDNGNPWDPKDEGSIVFDRSFNLSAKESQEWLLEFCHDIRNQTFYSKENKENDFCFMQIFKSVMEGPCENPKLPFNPKPCCNQTNFPYDPALFNHCAPFWTSTIGEFNGQMRFGEDSQVTGLELYFTSTTMETLIYENMSEFWYAVESWSKEKIKTAPPGLAGGWFGSWSDNQMFFFDLQESLARGTKMSIGLSLGMATAVLLCTTRNLLITLFATMSIAGTVFVTIGSLVLLGWELNILESTVMSLAVGLSVDFTIHYGVAYGLAPHKDRASRSTFAMVQLTSAITTAAFSTFIAGAVMLPSLVLAYQQIGIFLTLVMTVSWFYANFFFMPLCRAFGPEGNCAQIPMPSCSCCLTNQSLSSGQSCCCCCSSNSQGHSLLDANSDGDIDLGSVANG